MMKQQADFPPHWQICPSMLDDDERFLAAVLAMHEELYRKYFATDPMVNAALGFQLRAFRHSGDWRMLLVLTPWMLSRLMVPSRDPGIEIPPQWRAEKRINADYVLLGPQVSCELLGTRQGAHLNFHRDLGHYLLQPIVLSMTRYKTPEQVFEAWNQVIRTRDENMRKFPKDCPWQQEVSRREFFGRS